MFQNKIFSQIGCIASFNVANKPMPIFLPSHALATPCDTFVEVNPVKQKTTKEKFKMSK
jgi:hypothetical protein